MSDIRIASNFPRHPKAKRLRSILGGDGIDSLISLWCWASEFRPKGNLDGLSASEIEDAAEWRGAQNAFVVAIRDCGFLDGELGAKCYLHDWREHNSYAYFSRERSKIARRGAEARWKKHNENKLEMQNALQGAMQTAIAPAPAPTPAPSPSTKDQVPCDRPKKPVRFTPPTLEEVSVYCRDRGNAVDPIKFHAHYTANGWRVGKTAMKDWRASVVTWERS